jgi:hypothetical protein
VKAFNFKGREDLPSNLGMACSIFTVLVILGIFVLGIIGVVNRVNLNILQFSKSE